MVVRSAYPLKSFASLKEAQAHVNKIKRGASKHSDSKLEIHWNKKAKKKAPLTAHPFPPNAAPDDDVDDSLQWIVMVMDEDTLPGGSECAECETIHFEDDYLCSGCRMELES